MVKLARALPAIAILFVPLALSACAGKEGQLAPDVVWLDRTLRFAAPDDEGNNTATIEVTVKPE